jgi:hypothetical protein
MTAERIRDESLGSGPTPFSDEFESGTAVADGRVEVIHGVYAHSLPLAGMTIGQARSELEDRLNIDPDAIAVLDGRQVTDDTIVTEGSVLNFVKAAGEKG